MAVYLTTTPQVIGKDESEDIHVYLYGWYSNQSGNTCTVHARLTIISTTQTYADASKSYELELGGYDSGTQSWSYSPIETDVEYTVAETTWTYAEGDEISSSASFWVQGIGSINVSLDDTTYVTFATPPTDLDVILESIAMSYPADSIVELEASISSYGNYSGTPDKYIAVGLFDQNAWRNPSPSENYSADSLSTDFFIHTYESSSGALPLVPNTRYYYGGAASNGEQTISQMFGECVTLPNDVNIRLVSRVGTNVTFEYSLDSDGGYYSKSLQYDVDESGNWTTFATISTGNAVNWTSFTISNISANEAHRIDFIVSTPAGYSLMNSHIYLTSPDTKFYGSVGDETTLVDSFYGSVNNQARKVTKLYGSDGNHAQLIHQGFGHVNYNE